jgi:hypothetical protein
LLALLLMLEVASLLLPPRTKLLERDMVRNLKGGKIYGYELDAVNVLDALQLD